MIRALGVIGALLLVSAPTQTLDRTEAHTRERGSLAEDPVLPQTVQPLPDARESRTSIAGFVVDKVTREPIQYANAHILGTPKGAMTSKNGSFWISGIEPGEHELVVMMLGYQAQRQVVEVGLNEVRVTLIEMLQEGDSYPFDEAPMLIDFVSPGYPAEAKLDGVEGTVVVKVLVGTDGTVQTSKVLRSSDSRFDDAALRASWLWKFKPAKWQGHVTQAHVAVPVHFSLSR